MLDDCTAKPEFVGKLMPTAYDVFPRSVLCPDSEIKTDDITTADVTTSPAVPPTSDDCCATSDRPTIDALHELLRMGLGPASTRTTLAPALSVVDVNVRPTDVIVRQVVAVMSTPDPEVDRNLDEAALKVTRVELPAVRKTSALPLDVTVTFWRVKGTSVMEPIPWKPHPREPAQTTTLVRINEVAVTTAHPEIRSPAPPLLEMVDWLTSIVTPCSVDKAEHERSTASLLLYTVESRNSSDCPGKKDATLAMDSPYPDDIDSVVFTTDTPTPVIPNPLLA
jgi:hypothetical protein